MNISGAFGHRICTQDECYDAENPAAGTIKLSDNIFMFPDRAIGQHGRVFEGEVKSSVYGTRPCVVKFARISEQNVKEAEILTKLGAHTNVIAIIQSGTYCDVFDDHVFIALDKCHNENLRQYLAKRKAAGIKFDLNQAIDFAKQIIAGVMYVHDNNVIHLDLKPSNILISQNLTLIKIADFGLSIIVKSPKSKVLHKRQFGTNGYRPVESFGNAEVSMRTDIFSLGTVLLHLLSNGNDVFGLDEHTFIHNVMNDVTDISGLLVRNPITTEHLIKCMVSKERCRRPTIWEVSYHPCWSGKEVECNFEYFGDDEIDDSALDDKDSVTVTKKKIESSSDIENERKFLAKMREMGFNRKPTIVVFDGVSKHLHRFDFTNHSMTQMHDYLGDAVNNVAAIAFGEYIYIFNFDDYILHPSQYSFHRLEYCDVTATWKEMRWSDWNTDKGYCRVAASSDAIYTVEGRGGRLVSKYDPSLDEWQRLPDRSIGSDPTVVCSNGFLYCIGGFDENYERSNRVERLDLTTMKWTRMANTNRLHLMAVAAECGQNIYVFSKYLHPITIEKYDPEADEWTDVEFTCETTKIGIVYEALVIDGDIFLIGHDTIFKYDVAKSRLTVVATFARMRITAAVLVQMSP